MKEQAMQKAQNAKEQVRELANAGRERVAGELDCVARALHGAGDQLGEDEAQMSGYTRLAGDKVGEVARYLREHDAVDLVHDAEDFARTHPLVFLGGCAVAGFLIGRFFKASAPEGEMPLELGTMPTQQYSTYTPAGYGPYDTRMPAPIARPPAVEHDPNPVVTSPTVPTPSRPGNGSQGG
jgi:hypothetical protein